MSEAEVREGPCPQGLAGWAVTIRVACPDCGQEHEVMILAQLLVGCEMGPDGLFRGRDEFRCLRCFGMEVA